ncbi:hypothetical protein [Fibrella forsythiae]|uniref:Uncharacterized protein n=1 Tax=Fibrella forsythiae TaxID=2817061 RepID=A0ABS3JF15_9BACT|nr:hypothetical protein [Fibrella forsythiae]MBO0948581.1 hypothetical protein [Fibrella forsythiae]
MSLQEIEAAMESLSINELAQVRDKAVELYQARWDEQLVIELKSGRLDGWIDDEKKDTQQGATLGL